MPSIPETERKVFLCQIEVKQAYIVTEEAFYSEDRNEVLTRTVLVPVSPEFYRAYNKMTGAYRSKQQMREHCKSPHNKWWKCNTDCATCPYNHASNQISLDGTRKDQNGDTYTMDQVLGLGTSGLEDDVADSALFLELLAEMEAIVPDIQTIAAFLAAGYAETEIAEMIGIPRSTIRSRLQKLKKQFYARYRAYKDGDVE